MPTCTILQNAGNAVKCEIKNYLGRVVRMIIQRRDVGVTLLDSRHHLLEAYHFLGVPFVACERHVFDKTDVDVAVSRELNEIEDFVIVESFHGDDVQLKCGKN